MNFLNLAAVTAVPPTTVVTPAPTPTPTPGAATTTPAVPVIAAPAIQPAAAAASPFSFGQPTTASTGVVNPFTAMASGQKPPTRYDQLNQIEIKTKILYYFKKS